MEVKFDVMLNGRFMRTLRMPIDFNDISGYEGDRPIVTEGAFKKFVRQKMPSVAMMPYTIRIVSVSTAPPAKFRSRRVVGMLLLLLLFVGCKTQEPVVVERVTHDTLWHERTQYDSVWLHDSIHVREALAGETLYITRDRWHTQYIERRIHDTLRVVLTDSVPVPYPVRVEVEKRLNWWQRLRLTLGDVLLIGAVACVVTFVWKRRR